MYICFFQVNLKMKKLFTTKEYKEFQRRKLLRIKKNRRTKRKFNSNQKRERNKQSKLFQNFKKNPYAIPLPIYAPNDFRLIDNTPACLQFFREIRAYENINYVNNQKQVYISLSDVEEIDYATISVLIAISDDLKSKKIGLQGDFPINVKCKNYIIESGFLLHMVDGRNRKFPNFGKSKFIFFEKGAGKLSREDNKKITEMIKDVVEHLTGQRKNIKPLKSILLEICGNSIEHGHTKNRQWLLGMKYVDNKVYFTVTDVGKGILETLFLTNGAIMNNLITFKSRLEILKGAFTQKYGSSTQEDNRNKGLPAIKKSSDSKMIKSLIVLTNNVILHFENEQRSFTFSSGTPRFKGTMYQWEINEECIINSMNYYHEN